MDFHNFKGSNTIVEKCSQNGTVRKTGHFWERWLKSNKD